MKTLYLEACQETRVELDGPSLLITQGRQAARRIPLRELARVIVWGNPALEAAAIRACLEAGIVVLFQGKEGPAGYAVGSAGAEGKMSARLQGFLERPDAESRYRDWRRSAERREIAIALRRERLPADFQPDRASRALSRFLPLTTPGVRELRGIAAGMMAARVAAGMAKLGADVRLLVGRPWFQFTTDCGWLLSWSFYSDWGDWLRVRDGGVGDCRRALAACLEEQSRRDDRRAARLIDGFRGWLGVLD